MVSRLGLVLLAALLSAPPASALTWTVSPGSPGACTPADPACATVQAAVTASTSGDTISILAGTYVEQVVVAKSLTLTGAGAAVTTIKAPAALTPSATVGEYAVVEVRGGATVSASGLTVAGPGPGNCASLHYGVLVVGGASLSLSSSSVVDVRDTPLGTCQTGVAIRVGHIAPPQTGSAVLSGLTLTGYQKAGVAVTGGGSIASVSTSTIQGAGDTTLLAQNGVQVSAGATATVSGCTISSHRCNAPSCGPDVLTDVQAGGVLVVQGGAGTVVSGNTLSLNDLGVYSWGAATTVDSNTVSSNRYEGIVLDEGTTDVTRNVVSGGAVGIAVVSFAGALASTAGTVRRNTLTGTATGLWIVDQDLGDAFVPSALPSFNRIVGNVAGVLAATAPGTPAPNNWFGCNAGPGAPGCDTAAGTATVSPWLLLSITAAPNPVLPNEPSTVTASLRGNSGGSDTSALGFVPDGIPVAFGTDLGTVTPPSSVTLNGTASTSLVSATLGIATASATVDNQTVTTTVTVPVLLQSFTAD